MAILSLIAESLILKFLNKNEKVLIGRNKDPKLSNIYNKSKSWNSMFWLQRHFERILSRRHTRNNLQTLNKPNWDVLVRFYQPKEVNRKGKKDR